MNAGSELISIEAAKTATFEQVSLVYEIFKRPLFCQLFLIVPFSCHIVYAAPTALPNSVTEKSDDSGNANMNAAYA